MKILTILIITLTIFIFTLITVKGAVYEFIYSNEEIFEDCPEGLSIHDGFDMSDLSISYDDGTLHCEGNITMIWDVQPSDRIELRADIFKFTRGTWQPTLFSLVVKDICHDLFDQGTMWFKVWSSNIKEEDRACLNNKGHIFHHEPFEVDAKYDFVTFMEGTAKFVNRFIAYDQEQNVLSTICMEVPGEIIKHRS